MQMDFKLEFTTAARRDFKKLPPNVRNAIEQTHCPKIKSDPFGQGEPLRGDLVGVYSYHFGRKPEYRILYFVEGDSVVIIAIGPHNAAYRKAKRRT
jgi:mRNA-degrading endonuclease RelE of RelBE toxin-antitoxin system